MTISPDFDISSYPPLPRLKGLFVTGTDTGVGKTVIAGAIARSLRSDGLRVEVFKPAASGCRKCPGDLISEDAEFLAACSDSSRSLREITPLRFGPALAPNVAAELSGKQVDIYSIFREYASLEDCCDAVVVEGIGGLLCPVSDDFWVIHFAAMTGLPMVIVARPNLGTINHTLLTISAARSAGINVAGVIINNYETEPVLENGQPADHDTRMAISTNPHQISRRGGVPVIAIVPKDSETSVSEVRLGQDVRFAINNVDWKKIL